MTEAGIDQEIARMGFGQDFVIIDTPGRDDPVARAAISRADTIVTPINDSFVDLDLIGQVDAETFKVKKPSFYAELIWDLRKVRAQADNTTVDWVLLRNRLQSADGNDESDKIWREDLSSAVKDAPVELKVSLGKVDISMHQLQSLQVGDVLPFRKPDYARLTTSDKPVFDVEVGSLGANAAVMVVKAIGPASDA
jgi:flagellar motor switch/type III secretory pathway protein FliN